GHDSDLGGVDGTKLGPCTLRSKSAHAGPLLRPRAVGCGAPDDTCGVPTRHLARLSHLRKERKLSEVERECVDLHERLGRCRARCCNLAETEPARCRRFKDQSFHGLPPGESKNSVSALPLL